MAEAGWDQPPQLFALVDTEELLRAEPQLAGTMGLVADRPGSLTPVAQEPLQQGPLDEVLAGIEFGDQVLGVVLAHEVLVLPPSAEAAARDADGPLDVAAVAAHPEAREVRMVVGVVRDGGRSAALRLRGVDGAADDVVVGADLAPALSDALLGTLV